MRDKLRNLKNISLAMILGAESAGEIEELRIQYLGKKGSLSETAKELSKLPPEEKIEIGRLFNDVKIAITQALETKSKTCGQRHPTDVDLSLPGTPTPNGHLHPVTSAIEEISSIFEKIGFIRVRYPEADWDWYAFESLNMSKNHPARDDWETFVVDGPTHPKLGQIVLIPHTSNGQVREMERLGGPPIRMVNIAKCYRRQSDVSHSIMFHQFEGLVVDENINITHLKGTIEI